MLVKELQTLGFVAQGVDISPWSVENAVCPGLQQADLRSLPFAAHAFDCLISQDVMEHIHPEDMDGVLSEQRRILAPSGVAYHFIPFYDSDGPFQLDAHLCNASKKWWDAKLSQHFRVARYASTDQWNYTNGILATYYELR